MDWRGRKVLVVGLGASGVAAARWLFAQGADVRAVDSRLEPPGLAVLQQAIPDLDIRLGPWQAADFSGVDCIVASPGVAVHSLPTKQPVVGDVELFAQAIRTWPCKVVAITGSNGKSTVTSMVGAMAQAAGRCTLVAGNIGLPVLEALLAIESGEQAVPEVVVLELSSFQLETTQSLNAHAATVLNLSEDHLDRYASMLDYLVAKARIFLGTGVQVLNRDDAWSLGLAQFGRQVRTFGLGQPQDRMSLGLHNQHIVEGQWPLLPCADLPLLGLHNQANAMAALALGRAIDLPMPAMLQALRTFQGLPHRVAWVADVQGVRYYDDSKGTNVGATEAALKGISQPLVLIAGGDGKGQDFSPLRRALPANTRAVLLIGKDAPALEQALAGASYPVLRCDSLEQAVQTAQRQAQAGDIVLLSPACASLDMFKNYVHRAEVFVQAVQALAGAACH